MRTMQFVVEPFDPCPLAHKGMLEGGTSQETNLLALDIETKILFVDEAGETFHEYFLPNNSDIQNCGGYVGKVIAYRDQALFDHFRAHGVCKASLSSQAFPLLQTRSPQLDLLLFELIGCLSRCDASRRFSLFDLGCTVAEHYDLLDVMLQAGSDSKLSASSQLAYCGLDKSAMLLTIARLIHPHANPSRFRLVQMEGSQFDFAEAQFDLSLSVGVVNHVSDPTKALEKILQVTRYACVLALWVTQETEGFWSIVHSGFPFYFFSKRDLERLETLLPKGRFWVTDFIPESASTQARSYIGIGASKMSQLGCYHLVYTTLPSLPFAAQRLFA